MVHLVLVQVLFHMLGIGIGPGAGSYGGLSIGGGVGLYGPPDICSGVG